MLVNLPQFGLGTPELFPDGDQLSSHGAQLGLQSGLTLGAGPVVRRTALVGLLARSSYAVVGEVLDVGDLLL